MLDNLENNDMRIQAIRVTQPIGDFYLAKIKARDLQRISTSTLARYKSDGTIIGVQRQLDSVRLKSISNYIQSEEMCFPSSIIVAANVDEFGALILDEEKRWKVSEDEGFIDIPDVDISTSVIVDGQHRLRAFEYVDDEYQDIELVCSIFLDLPNPYQAYIFATINGNQKKVDKSLALEFFGYDLSNEPQSTWSPEKLGVYFTRKFNFTPDSPLEGKIKLSPACDFQSNKNALISTAAMVEGIVGLISSNPQKDRDYLAWKRYSLLEKKSRLVLPNDRSVLRSLYLENKDDEIFAILNAYFTAVNEKLWLNAHQKSVVTKTIGISALFDLLKAILKNNPTENSFGSYIDRIADVQFDSDYFSLTGRGKTRLKRVLKYRVGLLPPDELKEDDREFV